MSSRTETDPRMIKCPVLCSRAANIYIGDILASVFCQLLHRVQCTLKCKIWPVVFDLTKLSTLSFRSGQKRQGGV